MQVRFAMRSRGRGGVERTWPQDVALSSTADWAAHIVWASGQGTGMSCWEAAVEFGSDLTGDMEHAHGDSYFGDR